MFKLISLTLIFVLTSQTVYSLDINQEDKQKHIAVSTMLSAPTYLTLRSQQYNKFQSASMAILLTLAIGVAKESNDSHFDGDDMQANTIGALSGILIPISFTF